MTGLRDWANEGGTPEECALLAASKNEGAPSSMRSRTLAALGVGAAVTASTVTATTTATAAATASGLGFGVAKIAGVLLLVSGVTAGGLAWHRSRHVEPRPAVTTVTPAANASHPDPDGVPRVGVDTAAVPEAEASAPSAVSSAETPVIVRPHAAPASSASLSKEVAALEKAHAAIAAHDPDAAIRALDRYRTQFPTGALSSEEAVLRVQAVLARGDKSNAAELANTFRATHPDSPYGRGVQDLVSKKASKP